MSTIDKILAELESLELDERIEAINELRKRIHEVCPFKDNPVDLIQWVKADQVTANDYNPNVVAPPEMELLYTSIKADGYTQPIVSNKEGGKFIVIDGFHRNRVGKECDDIKKKLHGYLPIVQIRETQSGTSERMASTIRHNRARGKHQVEAMSDIVLDLKRRNWSDEKIGKELGMDADEVLRLTQISGLAEMFSDKEFSEAWEAGTYSDDELASLELEEIDD